jgi:hypothetical protein
MCIPTRQPASPAMGTQSSVPAATSLTIGGAGAPRGAAQLGRLALRFGGQSSATPSTGAAQEAAALATPTPAATNPAANTPANEAQIPGVGTIAGSLAGLRFGNFNSAFA